MPTFVTLTADEKKIYIDFNDLQSMPDVNAINATFKRSELVRIWHHYEPEHVGVTMSTGDNWPLNLDGSNGFYPISWVDLGDGNGPQVPTSIENLHDLLNGLII